MSYGLTPQGFVPKTLAAILEEREASMRAAFGDAINLQPQSPAGQLVGISAEREGLLWELAGAVHAAFDPDQNGGAAQDATATLTGTTRRAATRSRVGLALAGSAGTVVPAGRRVTAAVPGAAFVTTADAALAEAPELAVGADYAAGDFARYPDTRVSDAPTHPMTVWAATSSGTQADAPPWFSPPGSPRWIFVGEGSAAAQVNAEAAETGPPPAPAGTLTRIETPAYGWNGVVNPFDGEPGTDAESDAELRARRVSELGAVGGGSAPAIRRYLLRNVAGISACTVFENTTMLVNSDGLPPKSIEALVEAPDNPEQDQRIFDGLLACAGGGIETHGGVTGTALDEQGTAHLVKFSRPQAFTIFVKITLKKDPRQYPATGDADVRAAVVAFGDKFATGKDVVPSGLGAQAFRVPGVLDVTSCLVGTSAGALFPTTIPMSLRQRALFDLARVEVISTDGVP